MKPPSTPDIRRRHFLGVVIVAGAAPFLAVAQSNPRRLKAAIIGHTGRGDYGHGLDVLFNGRDDVEVIAVADADEAGRKKAAERCRAPRQYADYRTMLEKEKPQLVSVAPRWTDQRHAMVMAALNAGAHVISEKPFTRTLAEGDEMLAAASKAGLKIAVAHQMRLAPSVVHLKKALEDGVIGRLLQIRAHGKQDSRAGGEDMIVLGTHLFNLMPLFAGDPVWCTARIRQKSREATLQDARPASEGIGLVLGDDIVAQFAFRDGVNGTFVSNGENRATAGHWGLELAGSKGAIRLLADAFPRIFIRKSGEWGDAGATDTWTPLEGSPKLSEAERAFGGANKRVVDDWLNAIKNQTQPSCSGEAGLKAVEMCMAVFQAGLSGGRVTFPLAERRHPLEG